MTSQAAESDGWRTSSLGKMYFPSLYADECDNQHLDKSGCEASKTPTMVSPSLFPPVIVYALAQARCGAGTAVHCQPLTSMLCERLQDTHVSLPRAESLSLS